MLTYCTGGLQQGGLVGSFLRIMQALAYGLQYIFQLQIGLGSQLLGLAVCFD